MDEEGENYRVFESQFEEIVCIADIILYSQVKKQNEY